MKLLLLLPLFLALDVQAQTQTNTTENGPVVVLSFKWTRDRQPVENAVPGSSTPAPEMTPANRNYERQRRVNSPVGAPDPNGDTLDGRSANIDRIVDEARATPPVQGFTYQVHLQNSGAKPVDTVFWEYRFIETANPENVTERQFVCAARIKPSKDKELRLFTLAGPSNVVNVKSLGKGGGSQFQESVVINRVEFADGTAWQRKDWVLKDSPTTAKASVREGRSISPCRGL